METIVYVEVADLLLNGIAGGGGFSVGRHVCSEEILNDTLPDCTWGDLQPWSGWPYPDCWYTRSSVIRQGKRECVAGVKSLSIRTLSRGSQSSDDDEMGEMSLLPGR